MHPAPPIYRSALDVSELMGPLVTQWVLHLTVRFDEELELPPSPTTY